MNLKNFLLLSGAAILIFFSTQCAPQEQPEEKTPELENASETVEEVESDPPVVEREFPKLDSTNAVPFLRTYFEDNPERRVRIITRLGTLKVRLFDDTPLHTANFLMMTKRDYFTGTEFIRVVPGFVVQGGNNESETEEIKRILIGSYQIPSEFHEEHIHKRGALAMARSYENNPEKKSSAYYFYFVHGRTFNEPQLMGMERQHDMEIPEWKRKVYKTLGGAPHLDGEHTVFGEIYDGMDVLDQMAAVETDDGDWPLEALEMKVEVIE